eukprot:gene10763-2850_t
MPSEEKAKPEAMDTGHTDEKQGNGTEETQVDDSELSEADRELKQKLDGMLDRLEEDDISLYEQCLIDLRSEIKSATSSMTSVPKPLKFLRPHYQRIKKIRDTMEHPDLKALTADIISLIATTVVSDELDCLHYRLLGTNEAISSWGHEYVRHLIGEVSREYNSRVSQMDDPSAITCQFDDLFGLAEDIVPYCLRSNAEPEACDLLMEVERLDMLEPHVDESGYDRVCLYLMSCVPYVSEPYDQVLLKTCFAIFKKFQKWAQCMQVALRLNNMDVIRSVFRECDDRSVRRQLAFLLGRQQLVIDFESVLEGIEEDDDELETLRDLMANTHLNSSYLALARELDISEPKSPEDVYKSSEASSSRKYLSIAIESSKNFHQRLRQCRLEGYAIVNSVVSFAALKKTVN